jgi:hypothetical protein
MKLYRIRHIPTGLYWRNSSGRYGKHRDQLTKDGKVWTSKPSLSYLGGSKKSETFAVYMNNTIVWLPCEEFAIVEVEPKEEQ